MQCASTWLSCWDRPAQTFSMVEQHDYRQFRHRLALSTHQRRASRRLHDPGIAHFSGTPHSSLARETIQNSLDARDSYDHPVDVSFEMIELSPDDMGRVELSAAIDACRREVEFR